MYFSVLPPLPFGAGSLSSSFFSPASTCFTSVGVSTFAGGCCCFFAAYYFSFLSFSSFNFFLSSASSFFFCSSFSFSFASAVYFSKLVLQVLTMISSALFWLEKKSVFLLRKPKTESKKESMFPFCWIMVMRMPSKRVYSVIRFDY